MYREKINELDKKIRSKDFRDFFKEQIAKSLNKLEFTRQIILSFAYSLFIISLSIKYLSYTEMIPNNFKVNALFALFFLLAFIPFGYNERYKFLAKNIFLKKILKFIGDFDTYPISEKTETQESLNKTGIFRTYKHIDCNTLIYGKYNNKNVEIQELTLSNHRLFADTFGLMTAVSSDNYLDSHTIITRNASLHNTTLENMKPVSINTNPQFGNIFHIFSTNEEDAKKIITDDLTDKLIKLYLSTNKDICCVFKNKKIYIFIENYSGFDMPFFKSVNNVKDYQEMLESLINILSVTEAAQKQK